MSMRSFRYFLFLCLTSGSFTSSFFPSRSFRYLLPFSTLTSGSFTLFLSFRAVHFVILLSFSFYIVLHPLRLPPFPFSVSISSRPSFRCNLYPSIRYFFPFVSTLLNPVRYFFPFLSTLPFRSLYSVPFASTLPFPSLLPSHRFKRFHPVHLPLPFVSMFPSRSFTSSFRFKPLTSLPPFFRFNSSFLFVLLFLTFLSCQLVHFIASILSLQLFPAISLLLSFRFNSFSSRSLLLPFPFNSSLPFPIQCAFRFNSSLPSITSSLSFQHFHPVHLNLFLMPQSPCAARTVFQICRFTKAGTLAKVVFWVLQKHGSPPQLFLGFGASWLLSRVMGVRKTPCRNMVGCPCLNIPNTDSLTAFPLTKRLVMLLPQNAISQYIEGPFMYGKHA